MSRGSARMSGLSGGGFAWDAATWLALACAFAMGFSSLAVAQDGEAPQYDPALMVESDVDTWLRNAEKYARDERFQDAAILFQKSIDDTYGTGVLRTRDGQVYVPVRFLIEEELRAMEQVLETYQSLNEGDAKRLLNAADGDEEEPALTELVRRYYLTNYGDDAAFRLGCLLMDRYDFVGARRMFMRALEHPNLDVPESWVWLRLAVAAARLNEKKAAEAWYSRLIDANADGSLTRALELVASEIRQSGQNQWTEASSGEAWLMDQGSPTRHGRMNGLPDRVWNDGGHWSMLWDNLKTGPERERQKYGLPAPEWTGPQVNVRTYSHQQVQPQGRGDLLMRWKQNKWLPTGRMLYWNDRVIFRAHNYEKRGRVVPAMVCLKASTGQFVWDVEDEAPQLERGDSVQIYPLHHNQRQRPSHPSNEEEVIFFGDQLAQAMSIHDGIVYAIEGEAWHPDGGQRILIRQGNRMVQPSLGNRLVAIDVATGKLVFPRLRGDDAREGPTGFRQFMAAPVPVEGLMIVPVDAGGKLHLLAFHPRTGEEIWERELCSLESMTGSPWTTMGIASHGSDVYVATGRGLVFAVSAVDGEIRWASKYERSATPQVRHVSYQQVQPIPGWQEDTVVPVGAAVLVMPSDAEQVLAFDRATGVLRSAVRDTESEYCLGGVEDGVIVAGVDKVKRYRYSDGKLRVVSEGRLNSSLGRGVLTSNGVYMPEGDTIVRRDVQKLDQVTGRLMVGKLMDEQTPDPLGNLLVASDQVFVRGMERIYALVDAERRLAILADRIRDGHLEALELRAQLHVQRRDYASALSDLRRALSHVDKPDRKVQVADAILSLLLQMAADDPAKAESLLVEAEQHARTEAQRTRVLLAQANAHASRKQWNDSMQRYLKVAANASGAVVTLPGEQGVEVLASAVAREAVRDLLIREPGLANLISKMAQPALEEALKSGEVDKLLGVYWAYPESPEAIEAAVTAAKLQAKKKHTETAESVLREMIRSNHGPTTASGLAHLASLHAEVGWQRQAAAEWRELASRYGNEMIKWEGQMRPAGILAEEQLRSLTVDAEVTVRAPEPPYERSWHLSGGGQYVLQSGVIDSSEFLDSHAVVASMPQRRIICRSADGKKELWAIRVEGNNHNRAYNGRIAILQGRLLCYADGSMIRDGHVMVQVTNDEVEAYSLVNGRALWKAGISGVASKNMSTVPTHMWNRMRGNSGENGIAAGAGVVVLHRVDQSRLAHEVTVLDSGLGQRRWTRRFEPGNDVTAVAVADGYVCVLFDDDKVLFYDRYSAELHGQTRLRDRDKNLPMAWFNGQVLYPTKSNRLMAVGVPDGKVKWAQTLGGNLTDVGALDENTCYAISQTREAMVVDMTTGKLEMKDQISEWAQGVQDMARDPQGRIYVVGRDRGGNAFEMYVHVYGPVRDRNGVEMIQRLTKKPVQIMGRDAGHGTHTYVHAGLFAKAGRMVPIAVRGELEKIGNNSYRHSNEWTVRLFDKEKLAFDEKLTLEGPRKGRFTNLNGPPEIIDGAFLISTNDGLYAFTRDEKQSR